MLGSDPIGSAGDSDFDSKIRTYLGSQDWLIYDHKKHEKFKRCVVVLGWENAKALVDEIRVNPGIRDPVAVAESRLGHMASSKLGAGQKSFEDQVKELDLS